MRLPARSAHVVVALAVTLLAGACSDDRPAGPADTGDVVPRLDVPTPPDFGIDPAPGMDTPDDTADSAPIECPDYVTALADCPFDLVANVNSGCPTFDCREAPCASNDDCVDEAGNAGSAPHCVAGNCVECWEDPQCADDELCRGGRCIAGEPAICPEVGTCEASGCALVTASEAPCPVCVCDSIFNLACNTDSDCQVISRHPFRRCLYGRCAECAADADCGGGECLTPGLCFGLATHPSVLYGTWLIGWPGGLNHYSYFRFEPDGVLRRGNYEPDPVWSDDIPSFPCLRDAPSTTPYLGTWEQQLTNSGYLVVRMSLNVDCDDGAGWTGRFAVQTFQDGATARFDEIHGDFSWDAVRMPTDSCEPDFASCTLPEL